MISFRFHPPPIHSSCIGSTEFQWGNKPNQGTSIFSAKANPFGVKESGDAAATAAAAFGASGTNTFGSSTTASTSFGGSSGVFTFGSNAPANSMNKPAAFKFGGNATGDAFGFGNTSLGSNAIDAPDEDSYDEGDYFEGDEGDYYDEGDDIYDEGDEDEETGSSLSTVCVAIVIVGTCLNASD